MKFYNRENELRLLNDAYGWSKKNVIMSVIWGRRRVGKTRLILEFLKNKKNVLYFFVDKKNKEQLLEEFSRIISEKIGFAPVFKNTDDFVKYLFELAMTKHLIVFFDEFQNWQYVDKSIFSILQKYYDQYHNSDCRLMIGFLGSIVSLIKNIFANAKEPLFGRAVQKIQLEQLDFKTVLQICRDNKVKDLKKILDLYAIFGGVPKYYQLFDETNSWQKSLPQILQMVLFSNTALLRNEVQTILLEEFGKNYKTYFSILGAVAGGKTSSSQIANTSGISATSLPVLLTEMINDFSLLKREVPVTEKNYAKSKLGLYKIRDNFMQFWFANVFANESYYEGGDFDLLGKKVIDNLPTLKGFIFEEVVKELLIYKNKKQKFVFSFEKIGSFWNRRCCQIDIVATNDKTKEIFFGECKLQGKRLDLKLIEDLKAKSKIVKWNQSKRKEYFGVFAADKVDAKKKKIFAEHGVMVWELSELV